MKKNKDNVKDIMLPHSHAKVEFYKEYLKRYLRILCLSPKVNKIRIYDLFCGVGIYKDGGKGSPIEAYEAICECLQDIRFANSDTEIILTVNDIDETKVSTVQKYINSLPQTPHCKVNYHNKNFSEMVTLAQSEISSFEPNTRNLFFIDPYGYKEIAGDMLFSLLQNEKTEVILFLPVSFMYRFIKASLEDGGEQYEALRHFTDSLFNRFQKEELLQVQSIDDYVALLKKALTFGSEVYATSYTIERDKANMFCLFFMTKHIFGLQKILEVTWELDELNGRGFRLPEPENLMSSLFEQQDKAKAKSENFERLKSLIIDKISARPCNNNEMYVFVLENGFLPKQANEVFKYLQKNDSKFYVNIADTDNPARKGSFYLDWKADKKVDFGYKSIKK